MRSSNVLGSWLLECAGDYFCVWPWAGAWGDPNVANLLGQLRFCVLGAGCFISSAQGSVPGPHWGFGFCGQPTLGTSKTTVMGAS